jgi:hypothetical protein
MQFLSVYPNAKGDVCPDDPNPELGYGPRSYVGMRVEVTKVADPEKGSRQDASFESTWTMDAEPSKRPDTPYYRLAVRRGDLVAADDATAKVCGVKFDAALVAEIKAKAEGKKYQTADVGEFTEMPAKKKDGGSK